MSECAKSECAKVCMYMANSLFSQSLGLGSDARGHAFVEQMVNGVRGGWPSRSELVEDGAQKGAGLDG